MSRRPDPILIVDDDESVVASIRLLLKQANLPCRAAANPDDALSELERGPISLVLQDMNFSRKTTGEEGLELLARIRREHPNLPVILITAWGSIELAVAGMKQGATDFVTKPWRNQHLMQLIQTSLSLASSAADQSLSREELDRDFDFSQIIGRHPSMLSVLSKVARVCRTDAPVLILGESGTGKELIADALHQNSHRSEGPFVKVNLGGVPATLFESEMFGHVKGAFTDANRDRTGRFQAADGGTIFLDEVGDLDRASQVKLLRILQDRSFQPVGSSRTLTTDVRVISATNRDLGAMVQADDFREDLLYRLNLITLHLPPLRERRSDIALIAQLHLEHTAHTYGTGLLELSDGALAWLQQQDWPGNVRQLRQTIERAALMSGAKRLERSHFTDALSQAPGAEAASPAQAADLTLEQMERLMIERNLDRFEGNVSKTAEALGLSRPALYRRMEKYGLSDPG
ncbi:MAG: sigma-54 dependent transcriptional regulator [Xanthomonadales bacterium]|nr:sigma-54 dependent transcriptional regulator [Xanthomonadales bacterium]